MGGSDCITVTAALGIAKQQLEEITLKIIGEVSELSINSRYKAVYFTVKDESSSLPCMIWNNRYQASGIDLSIGSLVEITGRFSLYAAKGRMNFDVFTINLAGEGNLRLKVANLAKKLEAEGLMSPHLKTEIPFAPERIGIVTSPRGAAVYDVMRTLRRRFPVAKIYVAGVGVEGANAPKWIMEGLEALEKARVDVILLVRGGGSYEDLMPFNDEALARRISSMKTPVVTGIGHEPDTSIADMVSDLRASTPTAAAEAVSPSSAELANTFDAYRLKLDSRIRAQISALRSRLDRIALNALFKEPMRLFGNDAMRLDDLRMRLASIVPNSIAESQKQLDRHSLALSNGLSKLLLVFKQQLAVNKTLLESKGMTLIAPYSEVLKLCAARLDAYSPLSVLSRGYSYVRLESGRIVKSISSVAPEDRLDIYVSDGLIKCNVISKESNKKEV